MEPRIEITQFWNALTRGGEDRTTALCTFASLPELKRDATLQGVLLRAEEFIPEVIAREARDRNAFRSAKTELLQVLDAIPSLVTSDNSRGEATGAVQRIELASRPLMNIDICMKCDEVLKTLHEQSVASLEMPSVLNCTSIEELKKIIGADLPPELISEFKKEGGAVIVGMVLKKKKT